MVEEEEVGTVMCTVSTLLNKIGQIIMIFALKYLVRTRRQMWTQQKQWRRRRKVLLWFVQSVINDRTENNGIFIEIPCNNAEVDVDVEEVSVEMVIVSVEQDLS